MSLPRDVSRFLFFLALTFLGPGAGQANDPPAKPQKTPDVETRKGQARINLHTYKMEKGNLYRITVKGEGFIPELQVDNQRAFANPAGSLVNDPFAFPPSSRRRPNQISQLFFTPKETKEYQITVGYLPGPDLGKGPLPYRLTIERATVKDPLLGQDSELEVRADSKKLEQGKIYSISVTGKGFAPEVQIAEGRRLLARSVNGRWFGFGPDSEFVSTLTFAPPRTADYRIVIGVGPVAEERQAPLQYTTQVVELKVAMSDKGQLTGQDPAYPPRGAPHKVHSVKLEAGKKYQIDMNSRAFDSYLVLEDSAGTVLEEDDDGGGYPNARLVFRPAKTDTYRIVATVFHSGRTNPTLGAYTLTVVENPHAQPSFAASYRFGQDYPGLPK
jgi:hypothetical protein